MCFIYVCLVTYLSCQVIEKIAFKNLWVFILKRNCYLLYMCKTCGSVSVVPKINVHLPTWCLPPQCQNVIYATGLWYEADRNRVHESNYRATAAVQLLY